jgi:hypothetical protein
MFYILQIWTLVCFAYMILQAVGKMPGCFSRDLEDKIQKYIWGSANGLCTPQVKFFYLVLLILNSTIAQSCNILLPFLTIFFCHIRTNSVKFDFFILWMKMDSLMLSQFDMWILATNKWWAPLYFNTILICCYLFPLELPLNIRRKDPRKTMNIYVDCHGSGDEEASCRDCKCRKKIMSTAGNPGIRLCTWLLYLLCGI